MNFNFFQFRKAAIILAAFLFSSGSLANKPMTSIENIRNKTAELLVLKQKAKAQQLILNYLKTERSRIYRTEASELLFDLGQSFMTREAQQEYETALIETIENPKKALKSTENCLKKEPENIDCLIQSARLNHRLKNQKDFRDKIEILKENFLNSNYEQIFSFFLNPENKSNKAIPFNLNQAPQDRTLFLIIFEIERAFTAKNYARVSEILIYSEKHFADWPDIAFYKNRLNLESVENNVKSGDDLLTMYVNKCKNLSRSVARKYRYDFDLCIRE